MVFDSCLARSAKVNPLMIKDILRLIKFTPRRIAILSLVFAFRALPRSRREALIITFDAARADDGTGAQIQRLIAVRALCLILGTPYLHTPIQQIAIHPLDPFQTVEEMKVFVGNVNAKFAYTSADLPREHSTLKLAELKISDLGQLLLLIFRGRRTLVHILNAYLVVDQFPRFYKRALQHLTVHFQTRTSASDGLIAVHYRQGVGGFAIYPGMKVPRQLPLKMYLNRIRHIQNENPGTNLKLLILTDAPKNPVTFTPPAEQKELWIDTPSFDSGVMSVQEYDFESEIQDLNLPYTILSGGDPLDAIFRLASSDFLLMSRSSLSYVGALLAGEKTEVFYPRGFWHPKLKSWKYLQ